MATFKLTISSPDGNVFEGQVTCLMLRGAEGDLAVLAAHAPFVTSVQPCKVVIDVDEENQMVATVQGGLLTVGKDSVTLLTASYKPEKE